MPVPYLEERCMSNPIPDVEEFQHRLRENLSAVHPEPVTPTQVRRGLEGASTWSRARAFAAGAGAVVVMAGIGGLTLLLRTTNSPKMAAPRTPVHAAASTS